MARQALGGMAWGIWAASAMLLASRFFVLPGYGAWAAAAAAAAFAAKFALSVNTRPMRKEALRALDRHVPHNLILAAGSLPGNGGTLEEQLMREAAGRSDRALSEFRRTKGRWMERRTAAWIGSGFCVLFLLQLSPSPAQQEAREDETEREIVSTMKKEVEKLRGRADDDLSDRLADLAAGLDRATAPEEAIGEAVKLQRELSLRDRLGEKAGERPSDGGHTISDAEAAEALAKIAGDADEQLAGLGRSASDSGIAIRPPEEAAEAGDHGDGETEHGDQGGQPPPSSGKTGDAGEQGPQDGASSGDGGQGSGEGNGESGDGKGPGGGEGDGEGKGEGNGEGSGGNGRGPDEPGTGTGAGGMGSGSRDFVSTPPPVLDDRAPIPDTGPAPPGGTGRKGAVAAEKGSVRPYVEAFGEYRDVYLKDAGRLGLPEDLQKVLSDYFSSMERRE